MTKAFASVIATILVCASLFFIPLSINSARLSKGLATTGQEYAEKALIEFTEQGEITTSSYEKYTNILSKIGYNGEMLLSVHFYEIGEDGKSFHYSVPWGEIREILLDEGRYRLPDNSYIKITVQGRKKRGLSIFKLSQYQTTFSANRYFSERR